MKLAYRQTEGFLTLDRRRCSGVAVSSIPDLLDVVSAVEAAPQEAFRIPGQPQAINQSGLSMIDSTGLRYSLCWNRPQTAKLSAHGASCYIAVDRETGNICCVRTDGVTNSQTQPESSTAFDG